MPSSCSGGASPSGAMLVRVVRAPHERTRLHMEESELLRLFLELREDLRSDVLDDGQVIVRRPQVLAEREHVAAALAQIAEDRAELLPRLAEAQHETAL